ncbi:MAG: hypothetical protein IT293_01715 [Deltaproteobacteria bacterium]|nr:hypothetical protein [Deltaproteobacteria bacterium]
MDHATANDIVRDYLAFLRTLPRDREVQVPVERVRAFHEAMEVICPEPRPTLAEILFPFVLVTLGGFFLSWGSNELVAYYLAR